MNHNFSLRTRTAALGFAVLAFSTTGLGAANAVLAVPVGGTVAVPSVADFAMSRAAASAQADNVHATLADIRQQGTASRS